MLRRNGFKIHRRWGEYEAVWELDGELFPEGDAVLRLSHDELRQVEREREAYFGSVRKSA